jgi:hypothetical protein
MGCRKYTHSRSSRARGTRARGKFKDELLQTHHSALPRVHGMSAYRTAHTCCDTASAWRAARCGARAAQSPKVAMRGVWMPRARRREQIQKAASLSECGFATNVDEALLLCLLGWSFFRRCFCRSLLGRSLLCRCCFFHCCHRVLPFWIEVFKADCKLGSPPVTRVR